MAKKITYSGYSTLKIKATTEGGKFYTTASTGANFTPVSSGSVTTTLSLTPSSYLVHSDYNSAYSIDRTTVIEAIWLE